MLNIQFTTRFKRDYRSIKKRGIDVTALKEVLQLLSSGASLPERFCDHPLAVIILAFAIAICSRIGF